MKSIPHLFADITGCLEDLYGLAIEGQQADVPPDLQAILLHNLLSGFTRLERIAAEIADRLNAAR